MLLLEKKFKQNFIKTYCNTYLSKVIKTGFSFNQKNIIVVYCFSTEFVKFTVRKIND